MRVHHLSFMRRKFLVWAAAFAALHWFALVLLDSFTFLGAHLPPSVLPLDGFILMLTRLYQGLQFPRGLLRRLWFSEHTPTLLNWLLAFATSALWGLALAAGRFRRGLWRRDTL